MLRRYNHIVSLTDVLTISLNIFALSSIRWQVACAADPLVALPAPPSHGDTSMQSQPAPRTLLTMVLSLKDIGLVKAVLRALATVVDGKPAARPNGLPYYSAVHIQVRQLYRRPSQQLIP